MNANDALPDLDFPGHDKLVAAIDAAVASGDEHAVTAALRTTLCGIIRDREVQLPSPLQRISQVDLSLLLLPQQPQPLQLPLFHHLQQL